jgi:hypothetical protein
LVKVAGKESVVADFIPIFNKLTADEQVRSVIATMTDSIRTLFVC